jgi:molybdate transport system ATP-binding protein
MSLAVSVTHRLGGFSLEARFETDGRLTALFGRSGSGKTTLVNVIAGLIRPDHARIAIDREVFVDTDRGTFVPSHKRRIGYVFQEGRLFPHLTVHRNLLYGRWFAGRSGRAGELDEIVDLLGLQPLLGRRPSDLSGGEKQRVAIGRALLAAPRLLLMDEPLAALDDQRKAEILPYIERLRDEMGIPIVYVSHSVAEVARLAVTVVVLAGGRVERVGPVAEVLTEAGNSELSARSDAGGLLNVTVLGHDVADGLTILGSAAGDLLVPRISGVIGTRLRLYVRAQDIMLALDRPVGISALNVLPASVSGVGAQDGPVVDVMLDLGGERLLARITRRSLEALEIRPGRRVFAVIKSVAVAERGGTAGNAS